MKSFKSIREGNSVEPGVSEIDDVPDDPMSFIEIKPKKTKMSKEKTVVETKGAPKGFHFTKDGKLKRGDANQDGNGGPMLRTDPLDKQRSKVPPVSEKVQQVDEAQMSNMEIQHAVDLHSKLKNNNPNMAHSNATKNAHISMVKKHGSNWRKKAGILEETEQMDEAYTDDDIAKGGTVIYKHDGKHYMSKVSHKSGGGAGTQIHTTSNLGHKIKLNQVVSTDASDWNRFKNIKEETEQMDEKLTSKDIKMAVGVAKDKRYAGGNMSGAVKTMEKMKPGLSKHPRVQQALKTSNEGIDFLKIWESIKPEEIMVEEEAFDPVAHKKEHDRLMDKHIEAHKAVSKAFENMKAQGKSPRFDIPENDKLNDIKQEIAAHNDKVPKGPKSLPGSAAHYYASKKSGDYTGD